MAEMGVTMKNVKQRESRWLACHCGGIEGFPSHIKSPIKASSQPVWEQLSLPALPVALKEEKVSLCLPVTLDCD